MHKQGIIRGALAVLWIGLGCFLFVTYRGHTVLVDNRNLEEPAIRASDMITVSIDGGKGVEFFRGDRERFSVTGSKHRINVDFTDGTPPFEGVFTVGIKDDMYLLSIPKMTHNIEPFIEVFRTVQEQRTPEPEELPADEEPFEGGAVWG